MLRGLLKGLVDLIYPNCCLICKNRIPKGAKQQFICLDCWENLEKNLPPFCAKCGRHLGPEAIRGNSCPNCRQYQAAFYFDRAFSPYQYTGSVKQLIHEFKYSGKDYLGALLGDLMNRFIRKYQLPIEYLDYILPVPLHKSRQREREFNQAQLLGKEIAREFNKQILTDVLIRIKPTKRQTDLAPREREANVENSFAVVAPELIRGKNLLLVDDVLTTGATSSQAARCLKNSGAEKVLLLTLAS
jgi:ComF family protein